LLKSKGVESLWFSWTFFLASFMFFSRTHHTFFYFSSSAIHKPFPKEPILVNHILSKNAMGSSAMRHASLYVLGSEHGLDWGRKHKNPIEFWVWNVAPKNKNRLLRISDFGPCQVQVWVLAIYVFFLFFSNQISRK